MVPWASDRYPRGLRMLPDPPVCLFVRGPGTLAGSAAGLVGTRRCTRHGYNTARELGRGLATAGIPVVSGLALGVDAAAHQGCLEGGGMPIAVTAAGGDDAVPPSNRQLARMVVGAGVVVSEFPPGTPVHRGSFPRRNRIIAGIASALVVVEAPSRSGALLTARTSAALHRPVGAVPGWVEQPQSAGCHQLIRRGAELVRGVEDVLQMLGADTFDLAPIASGRSTRMPTEAQWQALHCLKSGQGGIEGLGRALGCTVGEATKNVLELAADGFVVLHPDRTVEVVVEFPQSPSKTG